MDLILQSRPLAFFGAALIALGLLLSAPRAALAQDAGVTLHVGDAAPALTVGKWLKGEPVKSFEPGKLYIVEFWATWCGPCVDVMPTLSTIQATYAKDGVIVIGQDVWEEKADNIEPFVKRMSDKMDYRIATDSDIGEDGSMAKSWVAAAQQMTLPCAFVVDKSGKIAWIGHPKELEAVVKQAVAGTFDPQKTAADQAAHERMNQLIRQVQRGGDPVAALKAIDNYEKTHPEIASEMVMTRLSLSIKANDVVRAKQAANTAIAAYHDDPKKLSGIATSLADAENPAEDLLELAVRAAKRANELTKGEDYQVLDALAHVYFASGDLDGAIDTEDKAIHLAPERRQAELQATIDEFMEAKKKSK